MEIVYRWNLKSLLGYLPFGFLFGIPTLFIDLMIVSIFERTPSSEKPWVFWFTGIAAIFFTASSLFMFAMPLFQGLFGYIRISPEALEYQRWPFSKNRFEWKNVESIRQGTLNIQTPFNRGPLNYGSLLIRRDKPGWELKTRGGTLGSAKYHIIPISEFQGWDDGRLVSDLRLFAPHLS